MRRLAARLAMIGAALCAAPTPAAEPAAYLADFARATGMIETPTVCHILDLYVAGTPQQRAQGLMYIRELGEHEGMLFPYEEPVQASLWMKNTYIPLDMIFILPDGRITGIAANTTPLSEAIVATTQPVTAVLEVNGGFSAHHGVKVGDRFALVGRPRR